MSDRIDELMRSLHGNPRVVDPSPIEQKLQAIRNPTQQPRDGKNGIDGVDGAAGADGKDGRNGIDGTSGSDGADGKDGKDGKDGIDGMNGLDGAIGEQGDAGMNWRGTYRSDIEYWIGDVVGVSGSAYVCVAATNQAPPIGFGWELLVSRGAQGIRGIKGEDGVVGPAAAGTLTGATLASNVLASSLTSVGTLTGLTSSGQINCTNAVTSTSTTTGAIITAGGMGIAKAVFIGQGINAAGNAYFGGDFTISGYFEQANSIASTGPTNGALVTEGGIGVALDSFFGALIATTSDTIRIATQKTPASATATGTKGDIVHDTNYIYVCTAANTWKRVLISTW